MKSLASPYLNQPSERLFNLYLCHDGVRVVPKNFVNLQHA